MRVRRTGALLASMLLLAVGQATASEEWGFTTYQPLDLPNGILVCPVTYTGYYGAPQEVEMTCWENRVWHHDPSSKGVVGEAIQENLAFSSGVRVSLDSQRSWPNRPDTICVDVDASRLGAGARVTSWADTTLMASIVECIRASAGKYASRAKYLVVRIRGKETFKRYGGVFDLSAYSCGPLLHQFADLQGR